MTQTIDIIDQMLLESIEQTTKNTNGKHSGAFEKMRAIEDFVSEPYAYVHNTRNGIPELTKSSFHVLRENLKFSPKMTKLYEFVKAKSPKQSHTDTMLEFSEFFVPDNEMGGNTDGDPLCLIDVPMEFRVFSLYEQTYVIVQMHGGDDPQTATTTPKVFTIDNIDDLFENMKEISCKCDCHECYYRYDGYDGSDGFPKFWQVDGHEINCTRCKKIISLD